MAPISSKRRKLDHSGVELGSESSKIIMENTGERGQSSSDAEEDEIDSKITSKQPNRRPKQQQSTNESALYAGGMFKSSIFKLQIDEMLTEVQPNYQKRMAWVDDALHRLHAIIGTIEEREPLPVSILAIA